MDYKHRAMVLQQETIRHRRYFHQNAEVGTSMPLTQEYVLRTLSMEGISARPCGGGVTSTIGRGGPVILLRADMDALPMAEKSGLSFACPTGKAAHTCGHDLHAAMLLTAAKLLKENEDSLSGSVKLMFQTGEETLCGAKAMIADGILEDPKPDAALSIHVGPSGSVGECWYHAEGTMMLSCDAFRITLHGQGGHSAYPHKTADPIGAAVQICNALQHMIAYERDPACTAVLTLGSFHAGEAYNIIPETAELQGSIRTDSAEIRARLVHRIQEIAVRTAQAWRCRAVITMLAENPPLCCDTNFTKEILTVLQSFPGLSLHSDIRALGSDDFAEITSRIPSAYLFLSAGYPDDSPKISHNPAVKFNENVLPLGAALLAHCADAWLQHHNDTTVGCNGKLIV